MYICYIDEAGCTGALPDPSSAIQPVFVLVGLFVRQTTIKHITRELLQLKQRFFPGRLPAGALYHDWLGLEIKGSELRKMARNSSRNDRRFAYGVIGEALKILVKYDAKIVGRTYVKQLAAPFDGAAVYSSSVQGICKTFQKFLESVNSNGMVIADSRNKPKNSNVSHSIFTQKYSAAGDPYSRLIELPTFGHSDNHAALQLADLLCSALFFPIAAQVCADSYLVEKMHCHSYYLNLRSRYGESLKNLQYRYQTPDHHWHGGMSLNDPMNRFNASVLFR